MTELRCSRETALLLGAMLPGTVKRHRELRDAGHMLVRDCERGEAMFWPWALDIKEMAITRSS